VWITTLPELIATTCQQWNLEVDRSHPVSGSSTDWVLNAARDDQEYVLKLAPDLIAVGQVLALWDGQRAVRVVERSAQAVLMERLPAATTDQVSDEEFVAMIGQLAELHQPTNLELISVDQLVAEWWPMTNASSVEAAFTRAGQELIARADELVSHQSLLLHGDLHPGNLRLTERGVVAFDPQPLLGEPSFDLEPLLRSALDGQRAISLDELASSWTGDADRVRLWAIFRSLRYGLQSRQPERRQRWQTRLEQLLAWQPR
jgi:streptomycin 6-kinase